jgi:hypothetical protein
MGFLKKLFGSGGSSSGGDFYTFNAQCDHCGETMEGKVNMANDLSMVDEGGYHVRKVLIGSSGRCFQQIEVVLKFDVSRKLQDRQISGGKFLD